MTSDQVRQRVRSGEWLRVGRGWYLRSASLAGLDAHAAQRRRHQMAAIAAVQRLPGSTVCGPSAAILNGRPVQRVPEVVHLIAAPGGWTGRRSGLWLHEWELPPEHLAAAPFRITTEARTWVDVARVDGTIGAVITGDHMLRDDPRVTDVLARAIEELGAGHLLGQARRALPLLDGRRETPLESASACYFDGHDLPSPEWQVDIYDEEGFVGRVDCAWDDTRIVGEADGRLKYATGQDLYREKRREDRLRATGRLVIRWGWVDLYGPGLARRLAAALGNPTPSVIWTPRS
jgi:hypothetical protein